MLHIISGRHISIFIFRFSALFVHYCLKCSLDRCLFALCHCYVELANKVNSREARLHLAPVYTRIIAGQGPPVDDFRQVQIHAKVTEGKVKADDLQWPHQHLNQEASNRISKALDLPLYD